MCQADVLLGLQWSPVQITGKLPVSHETLYLYVHGQSHWRQAVEDPASSEAKMKTLCRWPGLPRADTQ